MAASSGMFSFNIPANPVIPFPFKNINNYRRVPPRTKGAGARDAPYDIPLSIWHWNYIIHKTHNLPGKFLSYMQSGLPVLASINPGNDLAELILKRRCWASVH